MGSYCELSINGIELYANKNYFDEVILNMFSPNEIVTERIEIDGEFIDIHLLRTTVKKAKRRFEILGCSEKKLKEYFVKGVDYMKYEYDSSKIDLNKLDPIELEEFNYYKQLTFDNYNDAIKKVLSYENLDYYETGIFNKFIELETNILTKHIINKLKSGHYLNPFFWNGIYENEEHIINPMLDLYICLFNSKEQYIVEFDLTSIINGGWIEESDITNYYKNFDNTTIIMAEGKTDIKVISKSLEILYPEYKHLYSFFDFENSKSEGSASNLTRIIKAFSAAKIYNNRIIAIFDNDTAAEVEVQHLKDIRLPSNILIMKLPILDFCKLYPTIGPTGNADIDINNLAVSIELFFGDDIIKTDTKYSPILWSNYVHKLKRYQGSISNKDEVIKKMYEKLNNPNPEKQDWSKLVILWESIFKQKF
ncbi:hypothetical protein SAMN02745751_01248 [Dethiosulfatibacter aminovorans DSM 17477]|uniref:HEPN/Toprim N-terminal domain-containing protein n=1 Tax=Dethiosulfatibacter aminovorans DSM 17477 TaxID=1121476 RepID=A0A1M6EM45_9FIRM|nr:HEPN/Toprim-associated domain-containing protein [Dethiosulfatibacter aminovorans]SHI86635.1 hypothetical protein SAMN02745751_01248 [Dethiosulfatibacter aminovorans DSM 17477]